jgi:L-Lysine epsilon oxidase N-terminal/L-lysine epsilon oxidase C-terminal domain
MPASVWKIHPAIGVARLGNADAAQFFLGPEAPGVPAGSSPPGTTAPPYKHAGLVKPQAVRFRIWEYADVHGRLTAQRELTLDDADVVAIDWQVHLANRKASFHQFQGLAGEQSAPGPRRNGGVPAAELEIDPGPRSVSGRAMSGVTFTPGTSANSAAETWPVYPGPAPPHGTHVIDYLGELRTDDAGRLIVIGGRGKSASNRRTRLNHYANNDGWFDDVSDGPVSATVTLRGPSGDHTVVARGAWVLVAPPDFAPALENVVTLYDLLYDMAARELTLPREAVYDGPLRSLAAVNGEIHLKGRARLMDHRPDFGAEIEPILRPALDAVWSFEPARYAHDTLGSTLDVLRELDDPSSSIAALRNLVFRRLRPPPAATGPAGPHDMPRLLGDDPYSSPQHPHYRLTLTRTQYLLLERWAAGAFLSRRSRPSFAMWLRRLLDRIRGIRPPPPYAITPWGLDRAALEACVGGAFFPGIEVGWQIRHAELFLEPFRIDHGAHSTYSGESAVIRAGHFSRQMAVPWQADFRDCKHESEAGTGVVFGWWPGQRPDAVYERAADVATRTMVAWHRPTPGPWPSGDPVMPTHMEMVEHWYRLGFVVRNGRDAVETERAPTVP